MGEIKFKKYTIQIKAQYLWQWPQTKPHPVNVEELLLKKKKSKI